MGVEVSQPKERRINMWNKLQQEKEKKAVYQVCTMNGWSLEKGPNSAKVKQQPVNMSGTQGCSK
ncbi:hypothetical protein L195_g006201 [Trifolium pratense]|uniref:Uncharacterized protein n=1 Tax=Trifolium pratense TaxID=57577 RepID=A0A2K3P2Y7_TRIPR|nr:hypothetical protein L195_g006201 [Trifolium pratense]